MSKLMYNGQEYSSGVNYGSVLPMSPSDSTKVDAAINSKADASTTYTKTEVDNMLPIWIKQTAGQSTTITLPFIFGYYYADQWFGYIQFPMVTYNTNYTISLTQVIAENVGDVTSKCSVIEKLNGYFSIRTTKTMPTFSNLYNTCIGRCTFQITFA